MKKFKCSQMMLLIILREKAQQLANRMIRDHKFHTDLE